jgi:hypothetical protein
MGEEYLFHISGWGRFYFSSTGILCRLSTLILLLGKVKVA